LRKKQSGGFTVDGRGGGDQDFLDFGIIQPDPLFEFLDW